MEALGTTCSVNDTDGGDDTDKICDGDGVDVIRLDDGDGLDTWYREPDGVAEGTVLTDSGDAIIDSTCPF